MRTGGTTDGAGNQARWCAPVRSQAGNWAPENSAARPLGGREGGFRPASPASSARAGRLKVLSADHSLRFLPSPVTQALLLIAGKQPAIGFSYERVLPHRPITYYYRYLRYLLIFQTIVVIVAVFATVRAYFQRKRSTV